jgi:hypothetical protein
MHELYIARQPVRPKVSGNGLEEANTWIDPPEMVQEPQHERLSARTLANFLDVDTSRAFLDHAIGVT